MKFFLRKESTMKKVLSIILLISMLMSMLIIPTAAGSPLGERAKELDTTYRENAALGATVPARPFGFTPANYGYGLTGSGNAVDGYRGYYSAGTTTVSTTTQSIAASILGNLYFDIDANVYSKNAPGAKYQGYLTYQFNRTSTIEVVRLYMERLLDDGTPFNYMANGLDVAISKTGEAGSWKIVYSANKIADDALYQVYETEDGQKIPYVEAWFEPTEANFVRIAITDPSSRFATSANEKRYFHINEIEAWTVEEIPEPDEEPVEEPAINSLMLFPLLMRHRQYETETTTTMFGLRVKHLLRSADAITFEKNGIEAVISADALKALKLAGSDKLVVTITGTEPKDAKVDVTVNGKAVDIEVAIPGAPEVPQANVVTYRWDFNDLAEKNGSGNLTDSERSTKGYSLKDGIITVTDRTTDFVLAEGFKLTGANDWTIEWKADLEKGSALFGAAASANNFIYLAYETSGWKFPFRVVTGAGKAYMIPLGDYAKAMTEMNTWKAEYTAKNTTLTLKIYNESTKAWDVVGSVAMAGDYEFNITNLFGRYKSGTDVCLIGSVDYVQVSTVKEEEAATEIKDVHYRWDFNDLKGKDGKGNLTDSEKSTKGYTIENGLITVTDRTTDFVIDEGFELADTYDWSIEWKAQLSNASALFGTTASANNFVYLAYTVGSWKNPVRITTGDGTSYMIPLGDYMNKMTEMNTWKLGYSAKDKAMSLSFYDETAQSWEDVGSVAIPDPFTLKLTNLFGRYKAGTDVCMTGTVDYIDVVAKLTVEK